MSLVPKNKPDRIAFFEARLAKWESNAAAIGTTPQAVTELEGKVNAARAAYEAQLMAQAAARSAVATADQAVAAMLVAGMAIIEQVRTKARTAGDGVYPLADLPTPSVPAPVGPPGTPTGLVATLKPNGAVELEWKCKNPPGCTGVIYQIYRKVEGSNEFTYLGGTGQRKFVDVTVPAGAATVTYQIQGVRSTSVGDAAEFTVNLGVAGGGQATAFLGTATPKGKPAKIAA